MNEVKEQGKTDEGQSRLTVGLERDSARVKFYKGADRGEPMCWRDIGPDEVWNAAWQAATKAEREACAMLCDALTTGDDWAETSDELCAWDKGASDCAGAIRMRSNAEITGSALLRSPG